MHIENIENKVKSDTGILEFIKTQVNIEIINDESFGHYPFQFKYISKDDKKNVLGALALNRIEAVLEKIEEYTEKNYKEILFSLDFPKGGDMENDFIIVFSIKDNVLEVIALEYDTENGEVTRVVKKQESELLSISIEQIRKRLSLKE